MYEIRSDKGVLSAKVSNSFAKKIINTTEGHFDTEGNFVFNEDMQATIHNRGDEFTIYFWKGYYLKKKKLLFFF